MSYSSNELCILLALLLLLLATLDSGTDDLSSTKTVGIGSTTHSVSIHKTLLSTGLVGAQKHIAAWSVH
jgi:hypothetical protein